MSARVTTNTPFTDKECLVGALNKLGIRHTLLDDLIITDRVDYYGAEMFVLKNGEYGFVHDSSAEMGNEYTWNVNNLKEWVSVGEFLNRIDSVYQELWAAKKLRMTENELRIEEEKKKQIVEKKRLQILENAKQKGYTVKEIKNGKQIQLVLVRTNY